MVGEERDLAGDFKVGEKSDCRENGHERRSAQPKKLSCSSKRPNEQARSYWAKICSYFELARLNIQFKVDSVCIGKERPAQSKSCTVLSRPIQCNVRLMQIYLRPLRGLLDLCWEWLGLCLICDSLNLRLAYDAASASLMSSSTTVRPRSLRDMTALGSSGEAMIFPSCANLGMAWFLAEAL